MRDVNTMEELEQALAEREVVLLKHGASCPISRAARRELGAFCEANPAARVCSVEVTGRRALSDEIERRLGVRHASPQLFLLREGRIEWQATHFEISARELMKRMTPKAG